MNEQTYPWYMANKDGMVTLCADKADAEKEAKDAQDAWPHMGPHRAVQLVEAPLMGAAGDAGWRDIESAPKDGTRVIVSWPMRQMDDEGRTTGPITSRHTLITAMSGGFWLEPDVLNASGSWFGDNDCFADEPDHWLELPAPPSSAKGVAPA